jgi:hypothetical protein
MGEVQHRVVIVGLDLPWRDVFSLAIKFAVVGSVVVAILAFVAWPVLGLLF